MSAAPITFDYASWVAQFPEMAGVSQAAAENFAARASLLVGNYTFSVSPVQDPVLLATVLNLATAHLAWMYSPQVNGLPNSTGTAVAGGLVGRITQAAEGSVNVSVDMPNQPQGAAWWQQTRYGAEVWQFLKPFRLARYYAAPRRLFNPPVYRRFY